MGGWKAGGVREVPVSSIRQVLLASMCLLLPHVAAAQSLPSATASPQIGTGLAAPLQLPPPKPRWIFSLTVFPFQIAPPLAQMEVYPVELTGEARVSDKVGVAFIAGAGRGTHNYPADGTVVERVAFDAGLSARYYLLGDFSRGLTLGWELYYFDLLSTASDLN